jgi:hypothetical protein
VPILLIGIARFLPREKQPWPLIALCASIPLVRYVERHRLLASGIPAATVHERMITPIHLHAEALIIGLLLAWMVVRRPHWIAREKHSRISKRGLSVLVVACSAGLALDVANKEIFAFTALGLIFGSMTYFVLLDNSWLTRPLQAFAFYPISRLSYGMYLNHFVVVPSSTAWAIKHVPGPLPVVFLGGLLLGTVISVVAATGTFLLVEHPFLELRGKLLAGDSRNVASSVAPVGVRGEGSLEGVAMP